MELHDAVHGRRTVQRYTGEPVPDEVLDKALAAAHMAPCHKLTWPWRFILLGPEGKEQLVQTAIHRKAAQKGCEPEQMAGPVRTKLGSAGTLMLVSQVLDPEPHRREEDTACAIQNLMLSLHAQGYGSKWSTGGFVTDPSTYAMVGIDQVSERLVGCILMGRAAAKPVVPPRPDVADLVRRVP